MTHLHIHAPQPTDRRLDRMSCPTCSRRTYFAQWFTPWYGWDSTCLRCGDSWQDGEREQRPFMPKWRQKSIDSAKVRWRRATSKGGAAPITQKEE